MPRSRFHHLQRQGSQRGEIAALWRSYREPHRSHPPGRRWSRASALPWSLRLPSRSASCAGLSLSRLPLSLPLGWYQLLPPLRQLGHKFRSERGRARRAGMPARASEASCRGAGGARTVLVKRGAQSRVCVSGGKRHGNGGVVFRIDAGISGRSLVAPTVNGIGRFQIFQDGPGNDHVTGNA